MSQRCKRSQNVLAALGSVFKTDIQKELGPWQCPAVLLGVPRFVMARVLSNLNKIWDAARTQNLPHATMGA